jgi:toxin ParE1/3/4
MASLRLSDLAKADLGQIHTYISSERPDAADRQIAAIFERLMLLAATPMLGQARDDLAAGLRTFSVRNYVICFFTMPDGIQVARVLHGARDLAALFPRGER